MQKLPVRLLLGLAMVFSVAGFAKPAEAQVVVVVHHHHHHHYHHHHYHHHHH